MSVSIGGMIGLYGGMLCGVLGWWFGRKKARENRGLDELYDHIWQKARSYSWYVTLGAIYVFFSLLIFGVELNPAMILGILLSTHLGSWGIIGAIVSINMSSTVPLRPTRVKLGIGIVATSIIVFTIISIVTGNWLFLLCSILPNLMGLFAAFIPNRRNADAEDLE